MDEITLPKRKYVSKRCWSDDEDKALMELWEDKTLSTADIADKIPRSKNSIIGRAHRLGLPHRDGSRRGVKPGTPRRPKTMAKFLPGVIQPMPQPPPPDPTKPFEPIGVPLLEAEIHQCRAIVGKDERGLAIFCGHSFSSGSHLSFCSWHLRDYTVAPRYR